jgi:hypothetical protein
MNKQPSRIIWLLGSTLAMLSINPVFADNGLIVLTREVQPRVATRQALAQDPNPLTVQAGGPKYANTELSDSDFAHINTGLSVANSALTNRNNSLSSSNVLIQSGGNGVPGLGATIGGGTTGGATNGISGRVNGALKSGLRPLQQLGLGQ